MPIDVRCPGCGRSSQTPEGSAGKRARCKCGVEFRIPAEDAILASLRAVLDTPLDAEVSPQRHEQVPSIAWPRGVDADGPIDVGGNPLAMLGISLVERPEREGPLLVTSPEVVLPDRCVKCNTPTEGQRLVITLRRSHAGTNLMQILFFLAFSILWVQSDVAEIEVGICRRHMRRVRLWSTLSGCLIAASIGMIVAGVALGAEYGYLLLAGIVLLISAPIYMSLGGRLLSAPRIEPHRIWVKGVCEEYLSSLPERNHQRT
jgi:hypothetical protein